MVFRFTNLFLALLRLAARVCFSLAAIAYAISSLAADREYGLGLRSMEPQHFARAAAFFPLLRAHRSGLAYYSITVFDVQGIPAIREAIRHDPNATDLWFALLRLELHVHNDEAYNEAMARLKELTPDLRYTPILR